MHPCLQISKKKTKDPIKIPVTLSKGNFIIFLNMELKLIFQPDCFSDVTSAATLTFEFVDSSINEVWIEAELATKAMTSTITFLPGRFHNSIFPNV